MKLLVQARKDGYNVLYPKPTPTEFFQFAGDIRSIDNNSGNFLGKYIYSIAFASGGCIFTKHVIVQDVQRQGLGNVGFSVFIPNFNKLSGVDVKTLLDELLKTYCENYCPDYYLVDKQEDWEVFNKIAEKFDSRLDQHSAIDVKDYQEGTGEAAFIYYLDDSQLEKYFDAPYQKEYQSYKQVFFVEKRLKDAPDNPIKALCHNSYANLTDKIDLSITIVLKVNAIDRKTHEPIYNFKLKRLNDQSGFIQEKDTELIFKNDEINIPWVITVEHSDYDPDQFQYFPAEHHNIKDIRLKKRQYSDIGYKFGNAQKGKKYQIKFDKNKGKKSYLGQYIPDSVSDDPYFGLDPKSGYKFIKWELISNPNNDGNDYYEAIFKELWHRKISTWVWIFLVFLVLAILTIFVVSKLSGNSGTEKSDDLRKISSKINSYVDGIYLNKDTLEHYKLLYCNSTMHNEDNESVIELLQSLWPSQVSRSVPDYCSRIDEALSIRDAINTGNIDDLKHKTYTDQQQPFKVVISNIDPNHKERIEQMLVSLPDSNMPLNEIILLIKRLQVKLEEQDLNNQNRNEPQNKVIKQNQQNQQDQHQHELRQLKQELLKKVFWDLVNSGNTSMDKYISLYKNNRSIGGDIIQYLEKISNPELFKKFRDIPELDRIQADTLTQIDIN